MTNQPPTSTSHIHPTIEICNGYKHFGLSKKWNQAMRNVNLAAYSGEVYALLGPSGSGKTTILKVILGIHRLNEGLVKIFGFTPGEKLSGCPGIRVGYAPQSRGLFPQLTINETLRYYGKMLHLKSDYLNQRISYLSGELDLPPGPNVVYNCTGTQKRQISFAIALLHEPDLLVLDEPCQGTDPVHGASMWDHLNSQVGKGVTVFVTTQNVTEANKANRLGILRNGYLLMEGNPSDLVSNHKEKNLESLYTRAYAMLIRRNVVTEKSSVQPHPGIKLERMPSIQSEGFNYVEQESDNEQGKKDKRFKRKRIECTYLIRYMKMLPNCRRLGVIIYRDILVTFRNYIWLLALFIVPVMILAIFSYTVGRIPKNLNVGVVNFEASENDCKNNMNRYISCQVLKEVDLNTINLIYYKKYRDAESDAFKLKTTGVLIVGEKFTSQLLRTMAAIALQNMKMVNPDTSQLLLRLDMTSRIVANTVEHAIKDALEKYLNMATRNLNVQAAAIGFPMHVSKPIYGTENTVDTEYICNGLTVVFLYHMASFLASMTMTTYKNRNLLARDYIAGVRIIETIISHMIVYGILIFIEAVLMYTVLILILNLPVKEGPLGYLVLVIFVQIWCGLCFGFLIASLVKTRVQAGYVVFCFLCVSLMLCDVLWPLNGQPHWLLTIVKLLPQTQAIFAVRCIVQRGLSITTPGVLMGIVIPLVWMILYILLTYLFRK